MTDHLHGQYSLISTWECRTESVVSPSKMDEFCGTSIYRIMEPGDECYLEDYYFTRRDPQTKGKTRLKFVGRNLKGGI